MLRVRFRGILYRRSIDRRSTPIQGYMAHAAPFICLPGQRRITHAVPVHDATPRVRFVAAHQAPPTQLDQHRTAQEHCEEREDDDQRDVTTAEHPVDSARATTVCYLEHCGSTGAQCLDRSGCMQGQGIAIVEEVQAARVRKRWAITVVTWSL